VKRFKGEKRLVYSQKRNGKKTIDPIRCDKGRVILGRENERGEKEDEKRTEERYPERVKRR